MTTPRDELVQELAYTVGKDRAEQLADAFAHQLAEQIRQDTTVMGEAGDQYALCYADVIDPKAQR